MNINHLFLTTFLSLVIALPASAQNKEEEAQKQFDDCMESSQGTIEMGFCYRVHADQLHAMLDDKINEIEPHLASNGPELTDYAQAAIDFAAANKAWLDFVKHDCAVLSNTFGAGTAFALVGMSCEINHYKDRLNSIGISAANIGIDYN